MDSSGHGCHNGIDVVGAKAQRVGEVVDMG